MNKVISSGLLVVVMMFVGVVQAQEAVNGPWSHGTNITVTLSDDTTLTVSGTGAMKAGTVPSGDREDVIKRVVIGNGVTSVGNAAFYNFSKLASVTIPNGVTSIDEMAFLDCSSLTSVLIPNSVMSIGELAFGRCAGLMSVTIPNSVTSIGKQVFMDCKGLTSVTIPNSVTSIGIQAFMGCKSLTSVIIPNSVASIGEQAFSNCTGLTSVTIPGSVTSIGKQAFVSCTGLTSVRIGNGVTSIGDEAFGYCPKLTSVTSLRTVPLVFNNNGNNNVFGGGVPLSTASLYVPEASISAYSSAEKWKDFSRILAVEGMEGILSVSFDSRGGSAAASQAVEQNDKLIKPANPTRAGYVLVGWYMDSTFINQWNFDTDIVSADMTLYAKWALPVTVSFDSRGGSAAAPQVVGQDYQAAKPADPTRAGYVFGGWYMDSTFINQWNFETDVVSVNMTLYAQWTLSAAVTFNSLGGSAVPPQSVLAGGKAAKPANPTRTNYYFAGWYADAACTVPWDFDTDVITSDITLYAKWSTEPVSIAASDRVIPQVKPLVSLRGTTLTLSAPANTVYGIRLMDVRGKTVARFKSSGNSNFSLAKIPAGRYFVEARGGGKVERTAVIVGVR